MIMQKIILVGLLLLALISPVSFSAEITEAVSSATLEIAYPGLVSGVLSFSVLGDLPEGILLRSGTIELGTSTLDSELAKIPAAVQEEMKKNKLFLLEQLATNKILIETVKKEPGSKPSPADEKKLLQEFFEKIVSGISVTDQEAEDFYKNNKDMCGETPLEQMKDQIKEYVRQQKQQNKVNEYIRTLGQRTPIIVSTSWIKEQAVIAKDNPVDKARSSGLPSMVDFGASGCRPCDMMTPVLADLKKKYEGKLNVVFVHVREQQILGARYGIQTIPVQVFYDKNGKELFRHTGFYPQVEIEKKWSEFGVK